MNPTEPQLPPHQEAHGSPVLGFSVPVVCVPPGTHSQPCVSGDAMVAPTPTIGAGVGGQVEGAGVMGAWFPLVNCEMTPVV